MSTGGCCAANITSADSFFASLDHSRVLEASRLYRVLLSLIRNLNHSQIVKSGTRTPRKYCLLPKYASRKFSFKHDVPAARAARVPGSAAAGPAPPSAPRLVCGAPLPRPACLGAPSSKAAGRLAEKDAIAESVGRTSLRRLLLPMFVSFFSVGFRS